MANDYLFLKTVVRDANDRARLSLARICNRKRGKFKLTEREYVEELSALWVYAEFVATERLMRAIESDQDMDNKDNIRAALHIHVLDLYKIVKEKFNLTRDISIESLIYGKYSTEYLRSLNGRTEPDSGGLQQEVPRVDKETRL